MNKLFFMLSCCFMTASCLAQGVVVPPAPAGAQSEPQAMRFDGCTDRAGKPVPAVADTSLMSVAQLAQQDGHNVILFNPKALPNLLPESRLFVLANVCAQQYLGFGFEQPRTPEQVRQADCWAVGMLRQSGSGDDKLLAAIEDDLSISDWSQLPGPQRELKLASCVTPGARGALKIDTKSGGDDKWNTCLRACSTRLDACGRGNSCQAAFEQCVAACGK